MRILVCNSAHIGDLILTTAVLPVLKSAYPEAEIGVLIGSWARPVAENHTLIDHIHIFDHPHHNRAQKSLKAKKRQGSRTWQKAFSEVKEKHYDLAFDLYSLFPANASKMLYFAGIPDRVGWFSPRFFYYNYRAFWSDVISDRELHLVEMHGRLLGEYGIDETHLAKLKPTLTYRNDPKKSAMQGDYLVVHMGVGEPKREWNRKGWKELVHLLESFGLPLVFVGRGKKEKEEIAHAIQDLKNTVNLCDSLSFNELIPLIGGARLLVGLESMAGHVAAATETPAVLIYGGTAKIARWRPFHPRCQVASPPPECFDERGRAPPSAIHRITSEDVFQKVKLALSPKID